MLVQHVFPEFSSNVGHLRAKVVCSNLASSSTFYLLLQFRPSDHVTSKLRNLLLIGGTKFIKASAFQCYRCILLFYTTSDIYLALIRKVGNMLLYRNFVPPQGQKINVFIITYIMFL